MSKTHRTDLDVWSREEFEEVLSDLVASARSNDVHVEGTYRAWSTEGMDLEIEVTAVGEHDRHEVPQPAGDRRSADFGSADDIGSVDVTSRASLVQILTGLPLEGDECTAFCRECYGGIQNGDVVTAYCRKPTDELRWDVRDVYCERCDVTTVSSPSFGRADVVVEATVADVMDSSSQSSEQVLNDVRVFDYSPPPEGSV